jgi:hypothetical protein
LRVGRLGQRRPLIPAEAMATSRPASPPGLQSAVGAWLGARNQTRWLSPSRQSPPIHQTRLRLAQDRRSPVPRLLSGARRSRSMANCGPDDVEVFDALHRRGTVSRLCCTPWTLWTSTARTCPLRRWATARSGWRGSWVVRYRCCNHPPRHAREAFKEGYLAGWRSIRGAASPPPISCFTAPLPGETPFRVGSFSVFETDGGVVRLPVHRAISMIGSCTSASASTAHAEQKLRPPPRNTVSCHQAAGGVKFTTVVTPIASFNSYIALNVQTELEGFAVPRRRPVPDSEGVSVKATDV